MELRELDKRILDLINEEKLPQSQEEISNYLGYTRAAVVNSLRKLEEFGYIKKAGNSKTRQYYITVKAFNKLDPNNLERIDKEFNDITADTKDNFQNIKEKTEELEKQMINFEDKMNQFYVNIISIMAVFVAIFALININIKVIADTASDLSCVAIITCLLINLSAILTIGFMLLLIKWIIISPLKSQGKVAGTK